MPKRLLRIRAWWQRFRGHVSLRAQLVALTTLIATVVAIGLVLVVQLSLAGAAKSTTEQVLSTRASALVAQINGASTNATLTVPQAQLDPGVVIYDYTGRAVAGTVPPSMQSEFTRLSTAPKQQMIEGGEENYAILALPFTTNSGLDGVAILTEPISPYERNEQAALVVSLVAAALLILIAAGSAAWISKRVLSPVAQMAQTADEWSEQDLEQRFSLGPPTNEIRALGSTLDGLLDKVASAIRAEQRLTAELAHELRTPLTAIHGAAQLLELRTDLDEEARADVAMITSASLTMSNTITVLLDIARRSGQEMHTDRTTLEELAAAIRDLPKGGRAATVRVDLPAELHLNIPAPLAIRAIAPVLNNALAVSSQVQVTAEQVDRAIRLLIADNGPGVPDAWVPTLFDPGWSGGDGSGLGLALARRVARSGGGDVALHQQHNALGGATFAVTFPGGIARAPQRQ